MPASTARPRLALLGPVLLGLIALGAPACTGEPERPPIVWTGEHVAVGADAPEAICGGSLARLDRTAGALWAYLDVDPGLVDFYWVDDLGPYCTGTVAGCTIPERGEVFSTSIPERHELVHVRGGDLLPPVLEEGLATYLDDGFPLAPLGSRATLAAQLAAPQTALTDAAQYKRAAHFVAFLTETFGWPAVLELDALLGRGGSASQLDQAFAAATGHGTTALLELYAEFPDCNGWSEAASCTALEPVALTADGTFTATVDCASATTLGPLLGELAYTETLVTLPPPTGASRLLTITATIAGTPANVGAFAIVRSCGTCSSGSYGLEPGTYAVDDAELPGGDYVIRFYAPISAGPVDVGLTLSP